MRRASALALLAGLLLVPAGLSAAPGAEEPLKAGAGAGAGPVTAALPSDPEALLAFVKEAVRARDEDAFDRLVNWEGVRPQRRRLTLYQIRTTFGRPIKEATVEDFPADGLAEAEESGTLKVNMPVTKRLRIVFDEEAGEPGAVAANVFLLGQKDGVYRIAVLNAVGGRK